MDPVVGRERGKAGHLRNVTESLEVPGQLWLPLGSVINLRRE